MAVTPKIKHRITFQFSSSTCRYRPPRIESGVSKRYLYTHIHSSIIHNSQGVEATQVSINRWMDKQNGVYTYKGISYSLEKEGDSDAGYNTDKSWKQYVKRNKRTNIVWFHLWDPFAVVHLLHSCPTFYDPMSCWASVSFTISWSLLKLMSVELVMPSNHLILCTPLSSCPQSFPASVSFPMTQPFISGAQRIRASASVLSMNIQGWFPLGLTGLVRNQIHRDRK